MERHHLAEKESQKLKVNRTSTKRYMDKYAYSDIKEGITVFVQPRSTICISARSDFARLVLPFGSNSG